MNTFRNYTELQGKQLQNCDHVIFEYDESNAGGKPFFIELNVGRTRLYEINDNHSITNVIFELLGLVPFEFCKQYYANLDNGWEELKERYSSYWPPYYHADYESATKAVLALFDLIETPQKLAETSEILFID